MQRAIDAPFTNGSTEEIIECSIKDDKIITVEQKKMYLGLEDYLQRQVDIFSDCTEASFISLYETFAQELAQREWIDFDTLPSDKVKEFRANFSGWQKKYLALREFQANKAFDIKSAGLERTAYKALPDEFSRNSYKRVEDLTEFVYYSACRKVVMVGCGPLPATLLWLSDHHPVANYIGLDIDDECVRAASNLFCRLGRRNVTFQLLNGKDYNYQDVDFVYVANHVSPKKNVLETISATAGFGTQIVVREPTRTGRLFSEAVMDDLPNGFNICSIGSDSTEFFSYNLNLVWKGT